MTLDQKQVDDLRKQLTDRIAADTTSLVRLNLAELARETIEIHPQAAKFRLNRSDECTDTWFAGTVLMADGTEQDDVSGLEDLAYEWTVGYTGYQIEDAAADLVVFDNDRNEPTLTVDLLAAVAAFEKEH